MISPDLLSVLFFTNFECHFITALNLSSLSKAQEQKKTSTETA